MESQLERLATKFPKELISQVEAGGGRKADYVSHSTINERLLYLIGPFSFAIKEVIYNNNHEVEGVVAGLTAIIDGMQITVEEGGESTNPQSKTNGAKIKDASSDALKRCAMRLGCGLHLWSQEDYRLDKWLAHDREETNSPEEGMDSSMIPRDYGTQNVTLAPMGEDVKIGLPDSLEDKITNHLPRVKQIKRRIAALESGEKLLWDDWFKEHIAQTDTTKWSKLDLSAQEVKLTELESQAANQGATL